MRAGWFAAVGAMTLTVVACGGSDDGKTLTYTVEGDGKAIVRYVDAEGATSEEATVPLPFELEVPIDGKSDFQLYATNATVTGSLSCEVLLDEESLGTAEGKRFVGCEGSASSSGGSLDVNFRSYEDVAPDGYDPPFPEPEVPDGLDGSILYADNTSFEDVRDFVVLEPAKSPEPTAWSTGLTGSSACPRISPDGSQIAFTSDQDGITSVFVAGIDGADVRRVSPEDVRPDFCAEWSPDGTIVAYKALYDGTDGDTVRSILLSHVDGSRTGEFVVPEEDAVDLDGLAWSPDATEIAFISFAGRGEVSVIGTSGTIERTITAAGANLRDLHLSPDGDRYAAACVYEGSTEGVCTFGTDGGDAQLLTDETYGDVFQTGWSPDGKWIVFNGSKDRDRGLFAVSADGAQTVDLALFEDASAEWPSWYESVQLPAEPLTISFAR